MEGILPGIPQYLMYNLAMFIIDRILSWFGRKPESSPTLHTVAEGWSITPGHAEHYVQLYASRFNLTYQQALNLLQDLSLENVRAELRGK
jgi:hypothetical protein